MATGTKTYDLNPTPGNASAVAGTFGVPVSVIPIRVNAAEIIAADAGATLASATKITAGEEVTIFTCPLGFCVLGTVTYVTEAGTAAGTINIGTYANTTAFDAAVSIATAAAVPVKTATDAGGMDAASGTLVTAVASSADDVCVEFIADETVGEFYVTIFGLDLSACYGDR